MRRSTFTDEPVTYGAIGATLDPDLMRYPPAGFRPAEYTVRLGSGRARFDTAVASLLTWGVQRSSGIEVSDIESGTGTQYTGVAFDESGAPIGINPDPSAEQRFGVDGTPYIAAGMRAVLHIKSGPLHFSAPVRVVLFIEEPDRVGYAYGTLEGHPEDGEALFLVERRDDDSVWFTIRTFTRPSLKTLKALSPLMRIEQDRIFKRYLRALHPVGSVAPVAPASTAEAAGGDLDFEALLHPLDPRD